MMQDLVAQVANVGFPIAVSIYLLVRLEAKMETSLPASTSWPRL